MILSPNVKNDLGHVALFVKPEKVNSCGHIPEQFVGQVEQWGCLPSGKESHDQLMKVLLIVSLLALYNSNAQTAKPPTRKKVIT